MFFTVTNQIETLGLSGNRVREQDVEMELIQFLNTNKRLQTLILNYSRLSCQFGSLFRFLFTLLLGPCELIPTLVNSSILDANFLFI